MTMQTTSRNFGTSTRLQPFGESVFATISRLAAQHGAVNLGQGFPNFDGPQFVKDAGMRAIKDGFGQYARTFGVPELNAAVAARFRATSGIEVAPDAEVTVTSGCTEAIAAVMLGLIHTGDEVVLVEPFYDSYAACVAMAGGTVRAIRLRAPEFAFPIDELRRVVGPQTKAILINSPHNPLGRVLTRSELEGIAAVARAVDCLVFSDEVYEEIWYGEPPVSIATLPGMRERTVVMSSLGKTFSLTGWKIGWTIAPPNLTAGIRAAHQFLTFCSATPLQRAAVDALQAPRSYYEALRADYLTRRDAMLTVLRDAGFDPYVPDGSYFVVAEHERFGFPNDFAFAMHLVEKVGVACIPCSAFYAPQADGTKDADACRLVRFAFCKTDETIRDAGIRLRSLSARS